MKYPTYSMDHTTKRLSWPKGVPRRCPLCGAKIKFVGAGQGKIVHTLEGPVNEVPNMYVCRNPACQLHRHWFNPHPRIEYGGRHFGADVFKLVADEVLSFKADPGQIYLRLKKTYGVRISLRTVQRMCDDVINLKAFQVDANTRKMLVEDPRVFVVLDGEAADEGTGRGLWLFLDALRNRVLHTCVVESMDHERLHVTLEAIRARLGATFVGLVGDKQSCITKCHELYYPTLPLQLCQFHFLRNQWKHAEALENLMCFPHSGQVLGIDWGHERRVIVTTPGLGGIPPNPVDFHQSLIQTLPATQVAGTLISTFFGAATTLTGPLVGQHLDLLTNVTLAAQNITGLQIDLPAAYAAGNEYALHVTGGGATFDALYSVGAAGVIAGLFSDGVRSLRLADGTNAITVVAGITDVSVGALLVHWYTQAGDPALAANEIAMWTDTGGGPAYYLGANIPGVGVKKIAIA